MPIKVFYSWQNDTDSKCNRYLIRDAAEKAIKELNNEFLFESSPRPDLAELDHDTKGIPGHPEIVNTILEKIRNSQIFLADLTFVGTTWENKTNHKNTRKVSSDCKFLPNPNVMFELGYAFNVLNDSRFIFVQNTEYGRPENGIFDLAHRRYPLTYALAPNSPTSQLKQAQKDLSDIIKLALRVILENGVLEEMRQMLERSLATERDRIKLARDDFHRQIREGRFLNQYGGEPVWTLGLFPAVLPDSQINWATFQKKIERVLKPLRTSGWGHRLTGGHLEAYHMEGRDTGKSLTRLNRFGTILFACVETSVVFPSEVKDPYSGEEIFDIDMQGITSGTIKTVRDWTQMLQEIGIKGPWFVETALLNLPRCQIPFTEKYRRAGMDKDFAGGDIIPQDLLLIPEDAPQMAMADFASLFAPLFNSVWEYFNSAQSLDFDASGNWIK